MVYNRCNKKSIEEIAATALEYLKFSEKENCLMNNKLYNTLEL